MSEIIYRPQQKSEQELTNDFVIRLIEFKRLMDSIGNDRVGSIPQHILLQGKRGMGKTTLMYRVFYEVQKTKAESKILPVIFNEEQYSVRTLYKFWEQIAIYLEEEKGYEDLFEKMEAVSEAYDYEERCADLLFSYIDKHQHRLLLLVDNFGEMIYKFSRKDLQRLREVLVTTPTIKIIGGSSVVLESFYKYDQPFFDFFKVAHLAPLKQKDVDTLLLRLGEKRNEPHIAEIVNKQKGRVSALRILTGGVPRTIVMLFEIFLDAKQGESMTDLVNLLDKITPLYKHRMDELPPQQQEIVERLALHWDGMSVGELVKKTRMKSAAISSQLKYLERSDIVIAQKTTGKNKYYQIEERFFNIWYLMQHGSRKNQQKVIWLTRFLEFWCEGDGINQYATSLAKRFQEEHTNPDYIQKMTYAICQAEGIEDEVRDQLIQNSELSLKKLGLENFDLPLDSSFEDEFIALIEQEEFTKAKKLLEKAALPKSHELNDVFVVSEPVVPYGENNNLFKENLSITLLNLASINLFNNNWKKAGKYYLLHNKYSEFKTWSIIAYLHHEKLKDYKKAEEYYLKAIKNREISCYCMLAILYHKEFNDTDKAFLHYYKAVQEKSEFAFFPFMEILVSKNRLQEKKKVVYLLNMVTELENNHHILDVDDLTSSLLAGNTIILKKENLQTSKALALLWLDNTSEAIKFLESILKEILEDSDFTKQVSFILEFLIVKGLKNYLYELFQKEEYQLKDRYRVTYYTLLTFMQDEHPNEVRRMGKELEEPVQMMVQKIENWKKLY